MEGWAGFTDSDLKKMKGKDTKPEGCPSRTARPPSGGQRRNPQKPSFSAKFSVQSPAVALDHSMMLSEPKPKAKQSVSVDSKHTGTGPGNGKKSKDARTRPRGHSPDTMKSPDGSTKPPEVDKDQSDGTEQEKDDLVTDDHEIFKHEQHTMESFQKQQKMIEELNKKKRQILTEAIKERSKKAKAESVKLIELQKALAKLDQLITVDVSIIRDKIEDACREFSEAQKRYDRAEKEFVQSKIDLHRKMETKDTLTEHLYTIIYQNEMRKSKKLAELMTQLEMEASEDVEITECDMPHPSLINPVQLPAGRYGQIGPIHTQPTSPTHNDPNNPTNQETGKKSTNQGTDDKPTNQGTEDKSTSQVTEDKSTNQGTEDKSTNHVIEEKSTNQEKENKSANQTAGKSTNQDSTNNSKDEADLVGADVNKTDKTNLSVEPATDQTDSVITHAESNDKNGNLSNKDSDSGTNNTSDINQNETTAGTKT